MNKNFNNYSNYYNLIYKNKNYQSEVNHICKILEQNNMFKKNILEFGCGTGNHANFFIKKNYNIFGIEKSKNMLKFCKKINGFKYKHGDILNIKLKKKFDIILSLFHVLSYQTNKRKVNSFFKNASIHLKKNGILGFDFWYTPAVKFQKPETRLLKIKKKDYLLFRLAEPKLQLKKNLTEVNYTIILKNKKNRKIDIIKEKHIMKSFNLKDLNPYFKKYNFKIIYFKELVTNRLASVKTWSIFCMLKKTND